MENIREDILEGILTIYPNFVFFNIGVPLRNKLRDDIWSIIYNNGGINIGKTQSRQAIKKQNKWKISNEKF